MQPIYKEYIHGAAIRMKSQMIMNAGRQQTSMPPEQGNIRSALRTWSTEAIKRKFNPSLLSAYIWVSVVGLSNVESVLLDAIMAAQDQRSKAWRCAAFIV